MAPNGMNPVYLQSERLVLREWREEDFDAVRKYAADPEVVRHMVWGPDSDQDTRRFLRASVETAHAEPRITYEFAVTLRESGELIGGCSIRLRSVENRSGDLGYTLRRDCWGKGYATECARELLRFGFGTLNLHRIWATCDARNAASARVLAKIGMQPEGRRREDVFQRGEWRDTLLFAILESEFG